MEKKIIKILNIETSYKNCSVSIGFNDKVECLCEEISEDFKHGEKLHTFIKWALEGANIDINEIDAVAIDSGPGSYTGLRIGTASAKGICFSLDLPLISLNSLQIVASPYFLEKKYDYIIPIMDARRMEVYTSVFDSQGMILEEIYSHIISENSYSKYICSKVLFIGDAMTKVRNFFYDNEIFKNAEYIFSNPSAENMVKDSYNKYIHKKFENMAYFDPQYLKKWGEK